jgi:predicted phosphodiesterase
MAYSRALLLDLFSKAEQELGKIPTRREMRKLFNVTEKPFIREFHSWEEAKQHYVATKMADSSDDLVIQSVYDEDHLFEDMIVFEQRQHDITKVLEQFNGNAKVLSLSDIEIPYANVKMINEAVKHAKAEGAEIVILNGDITHNDFFSKHASDQFVHPMEEYKQLEQLVAYMSKQFKVVLIVRGNHDDMVERYCKRNMSLEMMKFLVRHDLLENVSERFDNVHYFKNWWGKVWDCVYAHPYNYSVVPMRTAAVASLAVSRFIDFRAFIIGHTHKVGQMLVGEGPYLVEQGCSCLMQPYQFKRVVSTTWWSAYNISEFKDGKIVYDNIKNYIRGTLKGFDV